MSSLQYKQELTRSGTTGCVEGRLVEMAFAISLGLSLYVKMDGARD